MKCFLATVTVQFVIVLLVVNTQTCFSQSCNDQQSCKHEEDKTVYFLLMVPYPDTQKRSSLSAEFEDGHDISPAAYLAVELINNRSDLLNGYKVELIRSDGGCSVLSRSVLSWSKDIVYRNIPLVGIIGPTCAVSMEIISDLSTNERIPLVNVAYRKNFSSFGILDSRQQQYKNYVQVHIKLITNRWNRIALLVDDSFSELVQFENSTGFEIVYKEPLFNNYIPLEGVRRSFARVIFVFATSSIARRLLCLAYHANMTFPQYQWIFSGHIDQRFYGTSFYYDNTHYTCSDENIYTALNGSLNFLQRLAPEDNGTVTDSGLTYPEYLRGYQNHIEMYKERFAVDSRDTYWANPAYDATWALALAMNKSLGELEDRNITFSKEDLDRQNEITDIIERNMVNLNFHGITGEVACSAEQQDNIIIDFSAYNSNGKSNIIGYYKLRKNIRIFPTVNESKVFVDDNFKDDSNILNPGIAALFLTLALVAFSLAIPAQIITVIHRNHQSIRASSHRLNHFIFVGFYIALFGIVIHTLNVTIRFSHVTHTVFCNVIAWCTNIGWTLILSTVCIKTWRLYVVFTTNGKPSKSPWMEDKVLIIIIGLSLVFELLISTLWTIFDPLINHETTTLKNEVVNGRYEIIRITNQQCTSETFWYYIAVVVTYKAIMLFISLGFAILTRNIYLKHFKTRNIIVLVYLLSLLFALTFPVQLIVYTTSNNVVTHFLAQAASLILAMYTCLCVLLIPLTFHVIREKYCMCISNYVKQVFG